MNSPPQRKAPGELGSKTGRKLITEAEYHALALLTTLFRSPFWFFEQRRARLADRVENERSET
jgi:hypothetical protein